MSLQDRWDYGMQDEYEDEEREAQLKAEREENSGLDIFNPIFDVEE